MTLKESSDAKMLVKGSSPDVFRVSISSAPSTSSHGSAQDDYDTSGDVYVWGDVICDSSVKAIIAKNPGQLSSRTDVPLPRPVESDLVLDVLHVACGVKHMALVTRQGELFTWGEESGGRLGHGVETNAAHPRLVESLAACNTDFVACGEFHTCAVTSNGELYTWGDGTHNVGLLGNGTNHSHWIPKRVSGPLEGIQVSYVTCGTWHTALITSAGQLFTFGDNTFGVLGHGNRESVSYPREVESLMGLKTIAVACGVWHTASIVEVMVTQSSSTSVSSGKLFTWGDGDKYRLGHSDKEPRLKPTCVPSLIDYNFHKVACGHSLTIGLTTSGRVLTMGSTVYGQLGNPRSDGKLPCLVEEKLANESVSEVSCGSYHVVVLTSKGEVYTWGKGANGRLGHGDFEDRKIPTLVEALKDRPIKKIACGSNFTAAICHHKWVSGAEQSQCASCRQAFGFTRKRHNCYNCGLVHCHSCTSRKSFKAALGPNPGKPYRVCDSCYIKLTKVAGSNKNNRNNVNPRLSAESKDKFDRENSHYDLIKNLDQKAAKNGKKTESLSLVRTTQNQGSQLMQLKDIAFSSRLYQHRAIPKAVKTSTQSVNSSRAVSPFSRKSSPPRSATPVPTTSGLVSSKSISDDLKKTNDFLRLEVQKFSAQVDTLRQRCELQDYELQKSAKKVQEAMALAAEESAKSKAAKDVIKSLTAQLKDLAERIPPNAYENEEKKTAYMSNGAEPQLTYPSNLNTTRDDHSDSMSNGTRTKFPTLTNSTDTNGIFIPETTSLQNSRVADAYEHLSTEVGNKNGDMTSSSAYVNDNGNKMPESSRDGENDSEPRSSTSNSNNNIQVEAEWIEQYEPGVYITLMALRDGTRDLKRVRFSRRRFGEHQAEAWWSENRERVYEKYNVRGSESASAAPSSAKTEKSRIL